MMSLTHFSKQFNTYVYIRPCVNRCCKCSWHQHLACVCIHVQPERWWVLFGRYILLFGRLKFAAWAMFNLFKKVSFINTTRIAIFALLCRGKKNNPKQRGPPASFQSQLFFSCTDLVARTLYLRAVLSEMSIFWDTCSILTLLRTACLHFFGL